MKKIIGILLLVMMVMVGCNQTNVDNNDAQQSNENNEVEDPDSTTNHHEEQQNNDNETTEDLLIDQSTAFFAAQRDQDIQAINDYLANSATYDEEADLFYFDKITYPHELERLDIAEENLEYRYIDEGAEETIVGFAAVNYEEEYSYVIDLTWAKQANAWKLKNMDINK